MGRSVAVGGRRHFRSIRDLNMAMSYRNRRNDRSGKRAITGADAERVKKIVMGAFYSAMQTHAPESNTVNKGTLRGCGQFKVRYNISNSGRRVRVVVMDNPAALKTPGDSTWRYVDRGTSEYSINREALFFYDTYGSRTQMMAYYDTVSAPPSGTTRRGNSKRSASKRVWYVMKLPNGSPWKLRSRKRATKMSIGSSIGRKREGQAVNIRMRIAVTDGGVPIAASTGHHFMVKVFDSATMGIKRSMSKSIGMRLDMANDYWDNKFRSFYVGRAGSSTRKLPSARLVNMRFKGASKVKVVDSGKSLRAMMKERRANSLPEMNKNKRTSPWERIVRRHTTQDDVPL